MSDYYDWNKTISFDADVTMVVGARGIGKTYGLRLQFIRDYIKDGSRFVELVRHKNELSDFASTYFDRIIDNEEFPEYTFKTEGKHAYIAKKPKNDNVKPKWELIGYFGALTMAQQMKKWTFSKVKRILLDEAIIDKRLDSYHRYLPNEYGVLGSIQDSVNRERKNKKTGVIDKSKRARVYLLGNSVDLLNPYFAAYYINGIPKVGYSWHKNKTMILHYVKDDEYSISKSKDTVAGRMLEGTLDGYAANSNEFILMNDDYVFDKPKWAKFYFGIIYLNERFGIWIDSREGYYYVTNKIPKNSSPIFALTASDNRVNYIAARRMEGVLKNFVEMYYFGIVRYESAILKEKFIEVLKLFGVR